MKPILFNTEMVRAILDGRKSVTRRVVKPRYCDSVLEMYQGVLCEASPYRPPVDNGDGTMTRFVRTYVPCKQPYRPGDTLYVRETWAIVGTDGTHHKYGYKADNERLVPLWHPSIHMPKEAARLFLRVTGVRVERLQDITITGLQDEGLIKGGFIPQYTVMTNYDEYFSRWKELWNSTIKKSDLPRYGWEANPCVWCVSFEVIPKEGVYKDAH